MKYAIILPDGAADEPVARFDGRTPLEVAKIPHMDWVASHGRLGRVVTVPDGFIPGSDVATMTLFGYDPAEFHGGRAPLEAVARGIGAEADQLIFRCNFVTIVDGVMADFTAGHISQKEADRLVASLNEALGSDQCRFHGGVSYRNLLVASFAPEVQPICTAPHDIPQQPVASHLPKGAGGQVIQRIMERAREILTEHEVNLVRRDMGENPATDIWLWGQGRPRRFPSFASRFGVSSAVIAAVDLIRGLAVSVGMEVIDVPGATGYLDTDFEGKGQAAVAALDRFDLVVCHVEAPDEAGHLGDPEAKVKAIEQVDQYVVGPMLDKLRTGDDWRILIAPDHPTPVERQIHTADPPPFCMAGRAVRSVHDLPYCEKTAAESDLLVDPGHELMEYFLRV